MPSDHQLFKKFPLDGSAPTSEGKVPTPYHIYDGHGILIGGTADLSRVQQMLRHEAGVPIETREGRAFMGIWVCNFTDASLGPHHELQFSLFVSREKIEPVSAHPLSLIDRMMRPELQMMCHGLWNNTPITVAYNRELLSLNSRLAQSHIENSKDRFSFDFRDSATGRPILAGTLPQLKKVSLRATWDLLAQLGFRRSWEFARKPWVGLQILNPTGVVLDENSVAESFTKNDINLVRYFNSDSDHLEFGNTPYAALNFKPQFAQYMEGFKFVYLHPRAAQQFAAEVLS